MKRSVAREIAMKMVFSEMFGGQYTLEAVQELPETVDAQPEVNQSFSEEIAAGVKETVEELDAIISEHAIGWTIERISKVDLAILRVALYEMLYRDDVPTGAAINEAVELAKRFGGDKSYSFVNGVLGAAAKKIEEAEA